MTFNCNGVRSAAKKGFFDWLPAQNVDVVCLQETKAQIHQLEDPMFHPQGYRTYYFDKTFAYLMPNKRSVDIDTEDDFFYAEFINNN